MGNPTHIQIEIDKAIRVPEAAIEVNYRPFHTPTINTKNEAELVLKTAHELFSTDSVMTLKNVLTASEDFSEYLSRVPGCFFLIGAGVNSAPVHTNQFDFPDNVTTTAASMMSHLAMNYLNGK